MPKVKVPDISYPVNFAATLSEERVSNDFYFLPNQDLDYLINTYNAIKQEYNELYNQDPKSVLFIGGVLYSGVIKGYDEKMIVDCVEVNPFSIITQLFTIYCIKNSGTNNSTLKHLLIDKFHKADKAIPIRYGREEVIKEFDYFKGFINAGIDNQSKNDLTEDDLLVLYKRLFNLKEYGKGFLRGLPKKSTNLLIVPELFEKIKKLSFRPKFPDNPEYLNAINKFMKNDKKYDLIMSNNVHELIGISFFPFLKKSLACEGLTEITCLRHGEPETPGWEVINEVSEAGKALNLFCFFQKNPLSKTTALKDGPVKILKIKG